VSAIDALHYDQFTNWSDWSVAGICFKLEGYNGWGYRKHGINSPYLWSFSNNYERGKYVADGHWDANAVSKQVGAVTALKKMVDDHLVSLKA
jgi:lysozyme family protein